MNSTEAIFQKAMASKKPEAILQVSRIFQEMGDHRKARLLHERVCRWHCNDIVVQGEIAFGAMARGTPIANTNGAVIPPGRYWQDIIGDTAKKTWTDWTKSKPEVKIETTEDHIGEKRLFVIFTIPSTASNYGMSGVFWPTKVLGFPTIADKTVTGSQDTVQRPPPMTSMDVVKDITKGAGAITKSFAEGLGLSPTKLALIGGVAVIALLLVSKVMIPKI